MKFQRGRGKKQISEDGRIKKKKKYVYKSTITSMEKKCLSKILKNRKETNQVGNIEKELKRAMRRKNTLQLKALLIRCAINKNVARLPQGWFFASHAVSSMQLLRGIKGPSHRQKILHVRAGRTQILKCGFVHIIFLPHFNPNKAGGGLQIFVCPSLSADQ